MCQTLRLIALLLIMASVSCTQHRAQPVARVEFEECVGRYIIPDFPAAQVPVQRGHGFTRMPLKLEFPITAGFSVTRKDGVTRRYSGTFEKPGRSVGPLKLVRIIEVPVAGSGMNDPWSVVKQVATFRYGQHGTVEVEVEPYPGERRNLRSVDPP